MTENVLVTGATGFIAGHFLEGLASDPRYAVRGFTGDIRRRGDVVRNLRDIDTVINFAALTYLPPSWDAPDAYLSVNTGGVINLLQQHTMFNRFVQISTSHVYGNQPRLPIEIDARPLPDDPYSVAKLAAEEAVRVYAGRYGFKALTVRPFNNFGPRQSRHFVVPTFCLQALRDRRIVVRGNTRRELIYVKDTARALKGLLDRGAEGLVQICRGTSFQMSQVAWTVAALAALHKTAVAIAPPYRETDIDELRGSPASLMKALTDFKFTSLEDGLAATFDYYKRQGSVSLSGDVSSRFGAGDGLG